MTNPTTQLIRDDWRQSIARELTKNGPLKNEDEYGDLAAEAEATLSDGL